MFKLMLFAFNFRNAIGIFKDVWRGTVFCERNINRCASCRHTSHNSRHPSHNPNGLQITTFNQVVEYLKQPSVHNVVVLAGAGISTPCGIPDFRSPKTGLYDYVKKFNLPYSEAIFDINYFFHDQKPFFSLAKEIYPGNFKPSVAHYFVKLLDEKGKLLRMYTQNIDGLEKIAGIPSSKVVEAHGTFDTATCMQCGAKYEGKSIKADIFADKIPRCKQGVCHGIIKPDIIFFGELLPDRFDMHLQDIEKIDLMIIMGTSLAVQPFSSVANMVPREVPRLLINKVDVFDHSRKNDIFEEGDLQNIIPEFARRLGWSSDLQKIMDSE